MTQNEDFKKFLQNKDVREYDFIFSLGAACICSHSLRVMGYVFGSYPFDWLCGPALDPRVEIVCNDFKNWFEKEDLSYIGLTPSISPPNNIYRNEKNGIFFNHDFPLGKDLNNFYESVREKYNRRIRRLFKDVENHKRICAVYVYPSENCENIELPPSPEEMHEAARKLRKKFGKDVVDLLYVGPAADGVFKYEDCGNGCRRIFLGNVCWKNNILNVTTNKKFLVPILKRYIKLDVSVWQKIKFCVLQHFAKVLPGEKLRKSFKRKYHIYT